jgi:hypothetical protein
MYFTFADAQRFEHPQTGHPLFSYAMGCAWVYCHVYAQTSYSGAAAGSMNCLSNY